MNYLQGLIETEEFQMDLKRLKQNIFFMRKIAQDQMDAELKDQDMRNLMGL